MCSGRGAAGVLCLGEPHAHGFLNAFGNGNENANLVHLHCRCSCWIYGTITMDVIGVLHGRKNNQLGFGTQKIHVQLPRLVDPTLTVTYNTLSSGEKANPFGLPNPSAMALTLRLLGSKR